MLFGETIDTALTVALPGILYSFHGWSAVRSDGAIARTPFVSKRRDPLRIDCADAIDEMNAEVMKKMQVATRTRVKRRFKGMLIVN